MRCLPGTSKSTAGASAPALRMSRACARNLIPPAAPPLPAPDRRAVQFCTCVLMNSEAGGPKKGRRTGCVASWAWGPGDAGALYPPLCRVYACASRGAARAGRSLGNLKTWVGVGCENESLTTLWLSAACRRVPSSPVD